LVVKSSPKSKSPSPSPVNGIIGTYTRLYFEKFGIKPRINGPWCGKMIKILLKDHSPGGISRVIELYFEDPENNSRVYHLPNILSSWSMNKYLPRILFDPQIYDNAEELNKDIW